MVHSFRAFDPANRSGSVPRGHVPDTDPILMKELAHYTKRERIADQNMFPFSRAPVMAVHIPTSSRNLSPPSLKAGIQPSMPT
jgi:hypothetical protein